MFSLLNMFNLRMHPTAWCVNGFLNMFTFQAPKPHFKRLANSGASALISSESWLYLADTRSASVFGDIELQSLQIRVAVL